MRICVSGSQCVGKSTFINDFIETFPMYSCPKTSYRDILSKKGLTVNRDGNQESQEAIMDHMLAEHMAYKPIDNVIHDRGILDNVIYSIYLNSINPELVSDEFIKQSLSVCQQVCKFYDIIFFLPILKDDFIPQVERENRDIDPEYRNSIDQLFKAAQITYKDAHTMFFDMNDCPALIEMYGNREERQAMTKFYIDPETGSSYPQEKTLLTPDLMSII